ncbi:MAG: hypothetical protein KC461_01475, partial [Dehalococcoidia bacterium]|nr:hypothetical protein [Dehalococcoidia bacterium]
MAMLQPGSRLIQSVGRAPDPSRDAIVERVHERLVEDLDVRALDSLPEGERKAHVEAAVGRVLAEIGPGVQGISRQDVVADV